jgi:hypothetical protein
MLFVLFSKKQMRRKHIIAGISLLTVSGILFYFWRRRRNHVMKQLKAEQVAEHGYETAHDILFPNKPRRIKRHRSKPR